MAKIPGASYTKVHLFADLEKDKLGDDSSRINSAIDDDASAIFRISCSYDTGKQVSKALAWYLLAASRNNLLAQKNIGRLYNQGLGVKQNYQCALKWYLKPAEQKYTYTSPCIAILFENGQGVPVDKYKALEWYYYTYDETKRSDLKSKVTTAPRKIKSIEKSLQQLIEETEAILEAEKKKLEENVFKTQEEIEVLQQLKDTYKLVDDEKESLEDIMVFVTKNKQPNVKSVDGSTVDDEDKALEKKNQNSLFEHEKSTPEAQTKELQSLKEGKSNYEIQIKEKDNKISLLESENSELKRERADLEHQIKARDNQISILENEKRFYHSSYTQQTQRLNSLMPEKLTMEQERNHTIDEMERLRSSFTTLEQLLKSKEDAMLSLYSEQEVNGIMETLTSLLQAKGSEVKLSKSNVKPTLDRKKKRNKMLQKEIEMLKQKQYQQGIHSQKASSPNNSTVLSGHASNADISNNGGDINNDMECGATDDDINYDTPSES